MTIDTLQRARSAARIMIDKSAQDLCIMDVRELTSFADFFIICSGRSVRQVQSIAEHTLLTLKREDIKPIGVEGKRDSEWMLLDYGDIVIHIFHEPLREFYDLEGLWSEARRVQPKEGDVPLHRGPN